MVDTKTNIHLANCPVCGCEKLELHTKCEDYFATKEVFDLYRCDKCKFIFTQGFPSDKLIGRYYDSADYVSHSDSNEGIVNFLYHQARKFALKSKARIVLRSSKKKNGKLLEIGSGTGYFLNEMKCRKWLVTGIEKSESARKYAKTKFDLDCQDSVYLYDIPADTKDVVVMWHVLEHLERLNRVMDRIYEILKADGTAVIAVPNTASSDAKHYGKYWAAYDVPRHLWHFSPDNFEVLANRHHFEVVKVKPMYLDAFYISMLSEKYKRTAFASLVGFIKGWWFFLCTVFNKNRSSSLIYVLKKK